MKLSRNMTNLQIAELLRSVAAAYQLKSAEKNKFKIIAYQRAADAVEHATSELKDLWDDGKLKDVPGIGASIAEHLDEIFRTGKSAHFEDVMKGLPPSMFELMKVPGIGAKTGFRLAKELKVKSLKGLKKAISQGKVSKMERFGEISEKRMEKSLKEVSGRTRRQLLPHATLIASDIMNWMIEDKKCKKS